MGSRMTPATRTALVSCARFARVMAAIRPSSGPSRTRITCSWVSDPYPPDGLFASSCGVPRLEAHGSPVEMSRRPLVPGKVGMALSVLVVDDDLAFVEAVCRGLRAAGY